MDEKKIKKNYVHQQDQSDCGVACLLMIIKYYDGNTSLEKLRNTSGTSISGTTLLGLYQAASKSGFTSEGCEANIQELISLNVPCILHVLIGGNLHHFVVCFGVTKKNGILTFLIGDPAKGIIHVKEEELLVLWQSKKCLTLLPNETFEKSININRKKRKWIIELIKTDFNILLVAITIGIAISLLSMVMAIFSQKLIDDILPQKNFTKFNLGISLVFMLLLLKEFLSIIRYYFLLRQSKNFNIRIIDFFYTNLLQLPKKFFDTRKVGDLTARLNDTSRIQKVISQLAGNVVIDALIAITSIFFIFRYSENVGFICLLTIPVFYLLIVIHNKKIIESQREIMCRYAIVESNYISTLLGIEAIKNYNKGLLFSKKNKNIYKVYQDKIYSLGKIQIKLSFLANSFSIAFLCGILIYTSYQNFNGQIKIGQLIAILGLCNVLLPSIANLALITLPINESKIAFDRMFEFTSATEMYKDKNVEITTIKKLSIESLSFRFAGRNLILRDISFQISMGEIIAIMGENGSGKSTLTQILQKHYFAETGNIFINDNISLNDLDVNIWRKLVGVVPQNIHIFNTSVLENIAFEDAHDKPQEVISFLEQYGFLKFLDILPQSYMSLIGEEGISLSGGQKQIIALARALYHQPDILILDEATSAMDRQTELFVLQVLQLLKNNMGVIFITHRLHVLKYICDRVYIIEDGAVSNYGTHNDLLQTENLYSLYWKDLTKANR